MPSAVATLTRRFSYAGALVFTLSTGCAPAANLEPLSNAEPEGPEVYFYGDAVRGGKTLPAPAQLLDRPSPAAEPAPTHEPSTVEARATERDAGSHEEPSANLPSVSLEKLPGSYRGTDTLTIEVEGFPDRVEKDDKAKLVVEAPPDGAKDRYTFKIVDSQNGSDLCSVTGVAKKDAIEFASGQTCLQEILGMPMSAELKSGKATLNGDKLTVDYEIDLEIDAPNGSLDGSIDYHFEGRRE